MSKTFEYPIMRRVTIFLILFLLPFSLLSQPPFYSFEDNFTLDEFEEVSPGIFEYQNYRMTIDETFTVEEEGQVFTLIKQVSITGILTLPGGRITIGGFTSGDGLGHLASIYSGTELLASQALWDEDFESTNPTEDYPNIDLVYANQSSFLIDRIVIRGADFEGFSSAVLLPNIKVSIDIPGYSISQFLNPFEDETDLLNVGGYIQAPFDEEFETFKVCADGSESSLFSLSFTDALLFPNDVIDFTTLNWQLRINEDPLGQQPERYGKITPEASPQPHAFKLFAYKHPTHLPKEAENTINLEILDVASGLVLHRIPIQLFPAPVLMVHGLWGNFDSFKFINDKLLQSSRYDEFQLLRCDYENSNDEEFVVNNGIVKECISGENGLIRQMLEEKIATGKVDIIAHSMGGLVSRLYLQSEDYNEDVNKLITIQTPHSGSQLANMLLDPAFAFGSAKFCTFVRFFARFGRCDEGAVNDLRIDSDAITELNSSNQPPIAKHAIVSTISYDQIPFKLKIVLEKDLMLTAALFAALFGGEPNDGIVSLSSQTGGLPKNAITSFQELLHTNSLDNVGVALRVQDLLSANPDSQIFTTSPFQHVAQTYNSSTINNQPDQEANIEIIQPAEGETFIAGDELKIQVRAPSETTSTMVFFKNDISLFPEGEEIEGNEGTVTFTVSNELLGKRRIGVFAYNNNERIGLSYLDIFVDTDQVPERVTIKPTVGFMNVGKTKTFKILGYFNSSSATLNELPGITYHFSNNNLVHRGENIIEAVTAGETIMTVDFRGIESRPVRVRIEKSDVTDSESGIEPQSNKRDLFIFPSPATNFINLRQPNINSKSGYIRIFDQMGRSVINQKYATLQDLLEIDISNLMNGMYIISLTTDEGIYSGKFIKL